MNRVYEWAFRLQDMVSPTLQRIQTTYSGTVSRMGQMTGKFQSMFKQSTQSIGELKKKLEALQGKKELMVDTRQIKRANKEIDDLQKKMDKLNGTGTSKEGGLISTLTGAALPFVGAAGLMAGVGGFAKMGMDREQTKVAFEQFVGKDGINPMMAQLNKFADVTPYSNEDVYGAGRTLLAAKVDKSQLTEKMTNLGNMSAVSQKDFGEMAGAYAKIKAKGFIDSGELHQEFGGTMLMDELKKNLKVDGEGLFKMAEKRQVRYEDVDKAIASLSAKGGSYEGGLDKLSQTAGGKMSTFFGTLENKVTEYAEKLNPMLGSMFDFGTVLLSKIDPILTVIGNGFGKLWEATSPLRELLGNLFDVVGKLFSQFGTLTGGSQALSAVFDVLAAVIWTISKGIQIVGDIVLWLADSVLVKAIALVIGLVKAWGLLNTAMMANPWTAVIVGVLAVASGIKYAWDNVESFRHGLMKLWEVGKGVFSGLGAAWDALIAGKGIEGMKAAFVENWKQGLANADKAIAADKKARAATQGAAKAGVSQAATGAMPTAAGAGQGDKKKEGVGKKAGVDATTGGTKSTNITINLKSLVERLEIKATGVSEGVQDMQTMVEDALLRVLNSANSIPS